MYERCQEQLEALRDQYGSDAVDDIMNRPDLWLSDDYSDHERELQAQIEAVRSELA